MVDADARRRQHVDELVQYIEAVAPLREDRLPDETLQFAQTARAIERWRIHLNALHCALHDALGELIALLVIEVHVLSGRRHFESPPIAVSTACLVGSDGTAPCTVVAKAPATAPTRAASFTDQP